MKSSFRFTAIACLILGLAACAAPPPPAPPPPPPAPMAAPPPPPPPPAYVAPAPAPRHVVVVHHRCRPGHHYVPAHRVRHHWVRGHCAPNR